VIVRTFLFYYYSHILKSYYKQNIDKKIFEEKKLYMDYQKKIYNKIVNLILNMLDDEKWQFKWIENCDYLNF